MAISKLFKKSVWGAFRSLAVRIKWPVEDIGKNSVMPSTIPKMTAVNTFITELSKRNLKVYQRFSILRYLAKVGLFLLSKMAITHAINIERVIIIPNNKSLTLSPETKNNSLFQRWSITPKSPPPRYNSISHQTLTLLVFFQNKELINAPATGPT
jgi:hypothetical protein